MFSTICHPAYYECIYSDINDTGAVFRPSPESVIYAEGIASHSLNFLLYYNEFIQLIYCLNPGRQLNTLPKHAYSNTLKLLQPKKENL